MDEKYNKCRKFFISDEDFYSTVEVEKKLKDERHIKFINQISDEVYNHFIEHLKKDYYDRVTLTIKEDKEDLFKYNLQGIEETFKYIMLDCLKNNAAYDDYIIMSYISIYEITIDINDFRKEKVSCAFSPTGMKEIKIPFANTLKEQIQNYVVEVFKALVFYMKHKYHEVIDLGNNIKVIKINVPGDVEKFDEIAEYFTKKNKRRSKNKNF